MAAGICRGGRIRKGNENSDLDQAEMNAIPIFSVSSLFYLVFIHLITNDDKHTLRSPLSMKLIEAIANHCFCVSYRWIIDCVRYDRIIDASPYEIESDDRDDNHGGAKRSRLIEKRHSLFENICFMLNYSFNFKNEFKWLFFLRLTL